MNERTHEEIQDARSESMLDAQAEYEDQRAFDGEDTEEWQRRSEEQGCE